MTTDGVQKIFDALEQRERELDEHGPKISTFSAVGLIAGIVGVCLALAFGVVWGTAPTAVPVRIQGCVVEGPTGMLRLESVSKLSWYGPSFRGALRVRFGEDGVFVSAPTLDLAPADLALLQQAFERCSGGAP